MLTSGCVCAAKEGEKKNKEGKTEKEDKEEGKEGQGGKWLGVLVCSFVICDMLFITDSFEPSQWRAEFFTIQRIEREVVNLVSPVEGKGDDKEKGDNKEKVCPVLCVSCVVCVLCCMLMFCAYRRTQGREAES